MFLKKKVKLKIEETGFTVSIKFQQEQTTIFLPIFKKTKYSEESIDPYKILTTKIKKIYKQIAKNQFYQITDLRKDFDRFTR